MSCNDFAIEKGEPPCVRICNCRAFSCGLIHDQQRQAFTKLKQRNPFVSTNHKTTLIAHSNIDILSKQRDCKTAVLKCQDERRTRRQPFDLSGDRPCLLPSFLSTSLFIISITYLYIHHSFSLLCCYNFHLPSQHLRS